MTVTRREAKGNDGNFQNNDRIQGSTESIQSSDGSIQESTESVQSSQEDLEECTESIQGSARSIQESTESIQESTTSIQECAENIQERPMYSLIRVNRFLDPVSDAAPLEDKGIQWNLRIMDTFGTNHFVLDRNVVLSLEVKMY